MRIAINSLLKNQPVSLDKTPAPPGLPPIKLALIAEETTLNASKQVMTRKKIREASVLGFFPLVLFFFGLFGANEISLFTSLSLASLLVILLPSFAFIELFKSERFRGLDEFPDNLLDIIASEDLPILYRGIEELREKTMEQIDEVVPSPMFTLSFMCFYTFIRFFVDYVPFFR